MRKYIWAIILVSTVVVTIGLMLFRPPPTKPPLFPKPTQILGTAGVATGQALWCSDSRLILFRQAQAFSVNTRSGTRSSLVRFNKRFGDQMPSSISLVALSPDGKWIVWRSTEWGNKKAVWIAATLDGSRECRWTSDLGYQYPKIAWMRDSRHWMEMGSYQEESDKMDALLFSVDDYNVKKTVVSSLRHASATALWFTPANHAVLASLSGGAGTNDFYDFSPVLATMPPHRTTINLPADAEECAMSSDGRRVAWLLYIVHPAPRLNWKEKFVTFITRSQPIYKTSIWVSNIDGNNLHQISPEADVQTLKALSNIGWTPDAKRVCFRRGDAFWTIPAN